MKRLIVSFLMLCLLTAASDRNISKINGGRLYEALTGFDKPKVDVFEKALLGYIDLRLSGKIEGDKQIISIVDFTIHPNQKRFWTIDIKSKAILYHTFVAHGENSGKEYAIDFSNTINSHQSSLGFYKTAETYIGKNGLSLRLEGLERKFNSNARKRHIVLHGADYATPDYIEENGILGNSEGCPAIPMGIHKEIIEQLKEGTCLFIYFPDEEYLENSEYMMN